MPPPRHYHYSALYIPLNTGSLSSGCLKECFKTSMWKHSPGNTSPHSRALYLGPSALLTHPTQTAALYEICQTYRNVIHVTPFILLNSLGINMITHTHTSVHHEAFIRVRIIWYQLYHWYKVPSRKEPDTLSWIGCCHATPWLKKA